MRYSYYYCQNGYVKFRCSEGKPWSCHWQILFILGTWWFSINCIYLYIHHHLLDKSVIVLVWANLGESHEVSRKHRTRFTVGKLCHPSHHQFVSPWVYQCINTTTRIIIVVIWTVIILVVLLILSVTVVIACFYSLRGCKPSRKTTSPQTPRLSALDLAYLLTCSNPCVGLTFFLLYKA